MISSQNAKLVFRNQVQNSPLIIFIIFTKQDLNRKFLFQRRNKKYGNKANNADKAVTVFLWQIQSVKN